MEWNHKSWKKYRPISHYDDVIIGAKASQITSVTIVYSTVYSGADQRKHHSSASLAFVWGIWRRHHELGETNIYQEHNYMRILCHCEKAMVTYGRVSKNFLTIVLSGWRLCCQTIRSQFLKFYLTNIDVIWNVRYENSTWTKCKWNWYHIGLSTCVDISIAKGPTKPCTYFIWVIPWDGGPLWSNRYLGSILGPFIIWICY